MRGGGKLRSWVADRFEKFTERALRALQAAQEEAVKFGRGAIDADHLLLGLLRDRTNVASQALARLDVNLDELADKVAADAGVPDGQPAPVSARLELPVSVRQTIEFAVDEARALSHLYVGTEHLLLGLVRQGSNSAAAELLRRGVTLQRARAAIVIVPHAPRRSAIRGGGRAMQGGGSATTVARTPEEAEPLLRHVAAFLSDSHNRPAESEAGLFGRLSEEALRVLELAREEARTLSHNYIGTEHILLGLVSEPQLATARGLAELAVDPTKVRNAIEFIIGRGDRPIAGPSALTPRAGKVVLLALDEAEQLGHSTARSEHLLLGVIREGEGIAVGILESLGVNPGRARAQMLEALGEPALTDDDPAPQAASRFRTERLGRLARKALLQAQLAARWYYQPQVDAEHVLLGLVRERGGAAARALQELGADLPRVLEQFEALTRGTSMQPTPERVEYTAVARAAIERAGDEAGQRGHPYAGTGHLLLGVLNVPDSHAIDLISRLGLAAEAVQRQVEPLLITDDEA